MPLAPNSRYRQLVTYEAPDSDGRVHTTVPIRHELTVGTGQPRIHVVMAGDTLESLAHRYLGSADRWWVIADANPRVFPLELAPGAPVVIPTLENLGRIDRRRAL
ncbi:MAG TPA: LysM domain-containing protein [Acidimicrobiales bacterium]|jgi:nucleoid-associated protein YgaU